MLVKNELAELRNEDRVTVSLPVNIVYADCFTRDVSASAVFLEANATFNKGEQVDFTIEFDGPVVN